MATSPLVDWPGCPRVDALGVGCAVTATVVTRFSAERTNSGVTIVWEIEDATAEPSVWLERSESSPAGPWTRPATSRSQNGKSVVELDEGAATDRSYWYRLVELDGASTVVIGAAIVVDPVQTLAFGINRVMPNPGSVPIRIEFSLKSAARISLDVFDIQGRLVATPAAGAWPAGRHVVEWSGTAPGMYLVRYRFPGGEDRRRLVRAQ